MKQQHKPQRQVVDFNGLDQINLNAAGLDIGAEEIYACVPVGRDTSQVRCFGTCTADLQEMRAWLIKCGVTTVAMESTGVYWIAPFEVLAEAGLEVYLVNARYIKNVSGRKTDVLDCQWIQQLHMYGLLQASFRPPEEICALRALVRHRDRLIQHRSPHVLHMQKALDEMNLKLTIVVSDITGVTGRCIIEAILAGERRPQVLAAYRQTGCQKSEAEIARALEGHYRDEQLFMLKQALALYDFYTQQIEACDEEIAAKYSAFKPQFDLDAKPLPLPRQRQRPGKGNWPRFDLRSELYKLTGVDLTQIDGVNVLTAQVVLSEIGADVSPWRTVKHFASWLGLCPNNKITGGKVKKRGRRKVHNRVAQALKQAAQSLERSQSALGGCFRRMKAKHGPAIATVAVAHKLARIIYFMLKNKTAYRDIGPEQYDAHYRERQLHNLNRQAARLGYRLEPTTV